jgi:hypothetical protein
MTPGQLEALSNLLARQLHALIWETSGPNEPPFRPTNLRHLFIKSDELKTLLEGHLRSMGVMNPIAKRRTN